MCDRIDKLKSALDRANLQPVASSFFNFILGNDLIDKRNQVDKAIKEYNRGGCDCAQQRFEGGKYGKQGQ